MYADQEQVAHKSGAGVKYHYPLLEIMTRASPANGRHYVHGAQMLK